MKSELEIKLITEFPFLRPCNDIYAAFGMECGDGWFNVVYGLCKEIVELFEKNGYNADEISLVPTQIKEKYGTLRFYFGIPDKTQSKLYDEIYDIVDKWEKISGETCESCGEPGVCESDGYWISTLCKKCRNEN